MQVDVESIAALLVCALVSCSEIQEVTDINFCLE